MRLARDGDGHQDAGVPFWSASAQFSVSHALLARQVRQTSSNGPVRASGTTVIAMTRWPQRAQVYRPVCGGVLARADRVDARTDLVYLVL